MFIVVEYQYKSYTVLMGVRRLEFSGGDTACFDISVTGNKDKQVEVHLAGYFETISFDNETDLDEDEDGDDDDDNDDDDALDDDEDSDEGREPPHPPAGKKKLVSIPKGDDVDEEFITPGAKKLAAAAARQAKPGVKVPIHPPLRDCVGTTFRSACAPLELMPVRLLN